jgi:hypothetical protein
MSRALLALALLIGNPALGSSWSPALWNLLGNVTSYVSLGWDPNGSTTDAGPGWDPNGSQTDLSPGWDPDGAQADLSPGWDPNG